MSDLPTREIPSDANVSFDNEIGSGGPFFGNFIPPGYMLCDGSAISRTTYSNLFGVIGTTYGIGDGSTTFNLPDMRGRFARGLDSGAGRDATPGRLLGSTQGDSTRTLPFISYNLAGSHGHGMSFPGNSEESGFAFPIDYLLDDQNLQTFSAGTITSAGTHTHVISSGGNSETRPHNIALKFIIKF